MTNSPCDEVFMTNSPNNEVTGERHWACASNFQGLEKSKFCYIYSFE